MSEMGVTNKYIMRGDSVPLIYLADNKTSDYVDIDDFVPSLSYGVK